MMFNSFFPSGPILEIGEILPGSHCFKKGGWGLKRENRPEKNKRSTKNVNGENKKDTLDSQYSKWTICFLNQMLFWSKHHDKLYLSKEAYTLTLNLTVVL